MRQTNIPYCVTSRTTSYVRINVALRFKMIKCVLVAYNCGQLCIDKLFTVLLCS